MKDTEAIALPPLRPPEWRGGLVPGWLWAVILLLVLGLGFGAGWWFQRDQGDGNASTDGEGDTGSGSAVTDPGASGAAGGPDEVEKIEDLLLAARLAMADEDWSGAQLRYERVLEIESQNDEARATLPKIADRLEAMRGDLMVMTSPKGATLELAGVVLDTSAGEAVTFDDVPVGKHLLKITREGYQDVEREVAIEKGKVADLGTVEMQKSVGALKVSSQPAGANYMVARLPEAGQGSGAGAGEVVVRGTTPADLPELSVGRYEVSLAVEGWPEHKETIEVRNKRETSVSHIFARGGLQITSDPSGAEVWLLAADSSPTEDPRRRGKLLGKTPLSASDLPSGQHRLGLTYEDWSPMQRTVVVEPDDEVKRDFEWKRGLVSFVSEPPGAEIYYKNERVGTLEDRTPFEWEFPEGDYEFSAVLPKTEIPGVTAQWSVRADVENEALFAFGYGSVAIRTDPAGATVLAGDKVVGATPFVKPLMKPGQYSYTLRMPNHTPTTVSGEVEPGQELAFNVKLKFDPFPQPGRDFTNVAGMRMKWVDGLRGWVGGHEVHQQAYERVVGENPSYFKGHDKPVDSVSWNDSNRFCTKLNAYEHAKRKVPDRYAYRLPNDEEWSYFVGDADLANAITSMNGNRTSSEPIGASKPNQYGLYDVRGNVYEWCEDWYSTGILNSMAKANLIGNPSLVATEQKFVRGGSWSRSGGNDLELGWRSPMKPDAGNQADVGFRVVLMPGG